VRTRAITATYLLASLVPFLESVWPRVELAQGSASALLWLVALALLTYPRGAPGADTPARTTLRALLALLPPLGLTLGLDLARGLAPGRAFATTLAFGLLLGAWCGLGEHAARTPRLRARYRDAWLWLGPGLATLALALDFVPRGAASPPAARGWSASFLVLAQRAALPGGLEARAPLEFALAGAAFLLAAALVLAAPREEAGR